MRLGWVFLPRENPCAKILHNNNNNNNNYTKRTPAKTVIRETIIIISTVNIG